MYFPPPILMKAVEAHALKKDELVTYMRDEGISLPLAPEDMNRNEILERLLAHLRKVNQARLNPSVAADVIEIEQKATDAAEPVEVVSPEIMDPLKKINSLGFKDKAEITAYLEAVDREKKMQKLRIHEIKEAEEILIQKQEKLRIREGDVETKAAQLQVLKAANREQLDKLQSISSQ